MSSFYSCLIGVISRVSSNAVVVLKTLLEGICVGVGGGMSSLGLIVVVLVVGGSLCSISCLIFLLRLEMVKTK